MPQTPSSEVASPCIQICQLDAAQICIGCGRSIREIGEWSVASSERRLQIRAEAQQRQQAAGRGNLTS
jgi:predicted Fe-S protein YdhL (DUF1289 family)